MPTTLTCFITCVVLNDFVRKLTGKKEGSGGLIPVGTNKVRHDFFEFDLEPVKQVLDKMIGFCNDSTNPNPLEQDGLPEPDHQKLLFEQLVFIYLARSITNATPSL